VRRARGPRHPVGSHPALGASTAGNRGSTKRRIAARARLISASRHDQHGATCARVHSIRLLPPVAQATDHQTKTDGEEGIPQIGASDRGLNMSSRPALWAIIAMINSAACHSVPLSKPPILGSAVRRSQSQTQAAQPPPGTVATSTLSGNPIAATI